MLPPMSHCRQATSRCLAAALPPPPRRRQADADLTLSRCRHRHCRRRRAAVRWLVVALLSAVVTCASRLGEYAVLSAYSVLSRNNISEIMQWEYYLSGIFVLNLLNFGSAERLNFL
jgi:hypothetical protein